MSENKFQIRFVLTFVTMLVMAMFLQSIVVMFLGVRSSIREDVARSRQVLEYEANSVALTVEEGENNIFSCTYVEVSGEGTTRQSQCRFTEKLRNLSQQAKDNNKPVVGYAGSSWNTFFFGSEVAIIAVPLVDGVGQVIGSIAAERSLLPIYKRYKQDVKIVLSYLLVNALLFSSLIFLRISKHFFIPLDNLVQKAETYRPDVQTLFLVSDNESPFRKLSARLSTLFERIDRDNSSLMKNVQELEAVNAELKEKNDLVVRSEKLATAGRLSAGLAHEIGNPLSIIQGYVELLKRDDLSSDEKKQFSAKALQELTRINRLVKQLLDFAGPRRTEAETVSVNSLIREVISFILLEKTSGQCIVKTKLLAEDDVIVADKDGLRQVLINCLFNAVDATALVEESEREIVIATSHEENSKMELQLVISVLDNGTGIAEEQLASMFDPFFTTKEVGRGTGLGLFVCHNLIERLQGTITLGNRASTGAEVRIVLPLRRTGQVKPSQSHS